MCIFCKIHERYYVYIKLLRRRVYLVLNIKFSFSAINKYIFIKVHTCESRTRTQRTPPIVHGTLFVFQTPFRILKRRVTYNLKRFFGSKYRLFSLPINAPNR